MGAALYKKEDYQKAIDSFTKALTSEDKKVEADALYNLGNCKYKLGKLKENTDLSNTIALLRESLDYYKRALDLDQKNTDARFNYEFVERELKVLLDKLRQKSEDRSQKTEGREEKEQQKQGNSERGAKDIEQSAQGEENKSEEEKQKEEQAPPQSAGQAPAEESQQEEQSKELSEEEAHALLERYGQEEAKPDYLSSDRQDVDRQAVRRYDREVLKDW